MKDELPELRNFLREVMERQECGLRGLEDLTGVSFATISRFLRGGDLTMSTYRRLQWFRDNGNRPLKTEPIAVKRFDIADKKFLVEIRQIGEEGKYYDGPSFAERARELMTAATEYNREMFHQWHECDKGCACYVCGMEQLLALEPTTDNSLAESDKGRE